MSVCIMNYDILIFFPHLKEARIKTTDIKVKKVIFLTHTVMIHQLLMINK